MAVSLFTRERGSFPEYFVWYFSLMVLGLAFVSACVFSLKKRFPQDWRLMKEGKQPSKEAERAVKAMTFAALCLSTLAVLMMGVEGPG